MEANQKKLHIYSLLVFFLLIFCFYILGGATELQEDEIVDTFNTTLPDANVEDLSETRLDAIYRAQQLKEDQERLKTRQSSSFKWLIEEDSISSEPLVLEAEDISIPTEEASSQERGYRSVNHNQRDDQFEELEKQIILERKRRELEEALGLKKSDIDTIVVSKKSQNIIVGKPGNKGFYGLSEEDINYKPDIRALVHGEYRNIKTGAIVKFRIIDEFTIDGVHIPKNTFLFGQLSFRSGRAMINIENIQYKNMIIPFNASIYDQDGFEGLYTPDNMSDEARRKMANDVISSTNLNISSGIPFVSSATNAVTSAIKSISQSAVREKKLNISSNYQVNIRYE